jgi:DNA-binding response OmpR family regulator
MSYRVLVIEDQREIANLVKLHLHDIDCQVKLAFDGSAGLADAEANHYDLIILDLMLPGENGLEICRRLRARADYTPILMLTSRASELDRVLGLEMGADDYLTKPFSVLELLAACRTQPKICNFLEYYVALTPLCGVELRYRFKLLRDNCADALSPTGC